MQAGVFLLCILPHFVHIIEQYVPAAFFCKVAFRYSRFPVAQVVVAHCQKAGAVQGPGQAVIPFDVFRHAMGKLHHALWRTVRAPDELYKFVTGCGQDGTLFVSRHG
jgi:hypothetical protein